MDDEVLIAIALQIQVEEMGLTVCGVAATAAEAIAMAQHYRPAVVLMDMRLRGEGDGVDASLTIYATVGAQVIFVTGSREPATIARINSDHPSAILFKPVSQEQLAEAIATARCATKVAGSGL
ncbi:response regulator [uncultured Phenylobacterium sp.]|uniref:response regulator n=1 Tax=uncultured Phenylobacterium sp. TaxID=349273 RepID=UPI0025D4B1F2|nr:response regulator [uncultured Phenylobacterium sp.]